MDEYREELTKVKAELQNVEKQIQELLERQQHLSEQKHDLETILKQHAQQQQQADASKKWDAKDFPWSNELEEKMASVFGISRLRPMQLQTMNVTISGKDCMLIMPTGGGKSLCFQLPALLSEGTTLVVSPLVSLMEDQLMALENLGVDAAFLSAAVSKEKVKAVQNSMTDKHSTLKMLYVTPEKLAKSKRFMNQLEKMYKMKRFARLVIDEVHCCSQWGHDFRPDYKFLGIMKRQFPDVPILGLTATATIKVLQDVKKILNIPNCLLFRASFNRPNLYYEVRPKPSSQKEVMDEIQVLIQTRFREQSGIVYCFSKKDSEEVTRDLMSRGIKAGCYHADLLPGERSRVHKLWSNNSIHVVVATVAFGMGIDKPNVRFVIHHSISKSMENLYQESGRAGRDEQKSHCIVFYRLADVFRQSTMVFTEQTGLENLYGIAAYCIDAGRCRRSMIARHFGEVWDATQCDSMCDHCAQKGKEVNKRDVTRHCQNVLKILDQASSTDQRVTAIKLIDALYGKGQGSLRVKDVETSISRDKTERIVCHMLLEGYLKEDFHFTPYSTISYLLPGSRAKTIRDGIATVAMEFEAKSTKAKSPSAQGKSTSAHAKGDNSESKPKPKPKLVVINREKSHISSGIGVAPQTEDDDFVEPVRKHNNSLAKKRRPVIEDSDDDDLDGLDFNDYDAPPVKKAARSKSSKVVNGSSSQPQNPICIDSDSNSS